MGVFSCRLLLSLCFVLCVLGEEWVIGFAAIDISPSSGERCCLGGYGACICSRDQTGIHDPVYARTMYLQLGKEELIFVSLDTIGMSNNFIDDAISNVSDLVNDPNRVILSSTHSHSSPDLAGLWGGVSKVYRSFVISQIRVSVSQAISSAIPGKLKIAKSWFTQTNNRRGWDGTDYGVLTLWGEDPHGVLIGMIVNFGSHPTILGSSNTLVSRDWVDGLIVTLEDSLGLNKAMYVNAAQGDVSASREGLNGTSYDKAFEYGTLLAQNVLASIQDPANVSVVETDLYFSMNNFSQCVTTNAFLAAADSRVCMDYTFRSADKQCPTSLLSLPPKIVDTQLAYVRLGREVQLAVIPGEALTRMAIDGVGLDFLFKFLLFKLSSCDLFFFQALLGLITAPTRLNLL